MAESEEKIIYFDSNATTFMSPKSVQLMTMWVNRGNPSSSHKDALKCKKLIEEFKQYIAKTCGITLPSDKPNGRITANQYRIIFTSCASESNSTILRSTATSYKHMTNTLPHIIISEIEHKSTIMCCEDMAEQGLIEYTMISPDELGFIPPSEVEAAIRPNTCLVCVMAANNETGVITDYKKIGAIAHKRQIPFYTDAVQIFGKYPIKPSSENVDAFSVSFHKLHGPAGIGLLVVKEQFMHGYQLRPIICGTQNDGSRGGTENIMLYAGAYAGMKETFTSRDAKNKKLLTMKRHIMTEISKYIPCKTYKEYLESRNDTTKNSIEVVFISTATRNYLPNTILLTVVKRTKPFICNVNFKEDLEKRGVIVSIGSACNTLSDKASHVLYAMNIDPLLRKGMLRISLSDHNTLEEAKLFVRAFMLTVKEHSEK